MSDEQTKKLSGWQWGQWSVPLFVTIGLFVATLSLDARKA